MYHKIIILLMCIKFINSAIEEKSEKSVEKIYFIDNDNVRELNSECVTSTGTFGQCKQAHNCPEDRFKLTLKDICFFEQKYPVVCCENNNSVNALYPDFEFDIRIVDDIFEKIKLSNRTVHKKCVEYQTPDSLKAIYFWGRVKAFPVFAGGERSKLQDNPQMAAIGWKSFDGSVDWKCGGSIISENFVITAAHCTYYRGLPADTVRVGDLDLLKNKDDIIAHDFDVIKIIVHPSYKQNLMYNDIALLKISPDALFSAYIRPACLWTEREIPVEIFKAMGYGTDAFAGKRTNELFEGNLTHVPLENCRQTLGSNFQLPNGILETQICAKDPAGKADTCQGDSGGPLVFKTGYTPYDIQHLIGITSFGEFCAGPTPGVYNRVSSYIDWIEPIVWPKS